LAARPARVLKLVVLLAAVLMLGSAGARGAQPDPSASLFFGLSPIHAVPLSGRSATRYSVQLSNAPVGNTPYARWYLELKGSASGVLCANDLLPGGARLSGTRYGWKNLGTTFTWFYGAKDSYPADPSYGCDQAEVGHSGYPGTLTVVFENDSEHCTAKFTGVVRGSVPVEGPPAACALGGYLPLPVPHSLLQIYARVDGRLSALVGQVQAGEFKGRPAALRHAIATTLEPQTRAFARFFPPVWGCDFDTVFGPMVVVRSMLDAQVAELAAGKRVARSALAADVESMRSAAHSVRGCRPTSSNPLGAPDTVVAGLDRVTGEMAAIRPVPATRLDSAALGARLRSIDASLNGIVRRGFPAVFGMPYGSLLDRVIAQNAAIDAAETTQRIGNTAAVVFELKRAAGGETTIGDALRKQARRAAKAEKAA
jgi:hypothetical protein